jgi:hypothetical protein
MKPETAQQFDNIVAQDVDRIISQNGGSLSGREYQSVMSTLRSTVRQVRQNRNADQDLGDALEDLQSALRRGAVRYSPREAVRDLRQIDRGYSQLMRAEAAAFRGAAKEPGRLNARDLMAVERRAGNSAGSRRRYLRGEQEGAEYAAAWNRLGQTVPDSGSPERLMTTAGGLGLIGGGAGAGAATAGISPLALLGLIPYAANTIGNLPGARNVVGAAMAPRSGPLAMGVRRRVLQAGPIAGYGVPAATDPWYGNDY